MVGSWFPIGRSYDFTKLIDTRVVSQHKQSKSKFQVICDIDKTYLETNFHSFRDILKVAFEDADEKITVTGASDVLLAVRWGIHQGLDQDVPRPLHFVSASPPQMRTVLEEKLALDGLDWNSDTFKNQAYNLRKVRVDQLRQHIAYKSAAILSVIRHASDGSEFFLIGDNAEFDAYIYTGVDLFTQGRLTPKAYQRYLQAAGVEPKVASDFTKFLDWQPRSTVAGILIREAPGYTTKLYPPLASRTFVFQNFFEAALYFVKWGVIQTADLWPLTRLFHNRHGLRRSQIHLSLSCLSQTLAPTSPLRHEIDHILARLSLNVELVKETPEQHPFVEQLLDQYRALSENEIIRHAEVWQSQVRVPATK